ncbi:hypothetical protein EDD22DRAFT_841905 [Suillus occidentalis]|nr:hypothetical protein EDD22DRAFT_841905 [Suillus occidentalis]
MKPATISFDNYIVFFTIPRLSPSPLAITNQKDYDELISRVKEAKDLTATVYVQEMQNVKKRKEIQLGKENDSATSDGSDSDSSNNNNDGKKKHKHNDKWKKKPDNTTFEKPPNHSHFSMVPEELLGQQSVFALCHQQLDEQA